VINPLAETRNSAATEIDDRLLADAVRQARRPISVLDASTDAPTVVYCNDAFCDFVGFGADEIVGRTLGWLLPNADFEKALHGLPHRRPCEVELQMRRRNGELFWNAVSAGPIFDESGRLTHIVLSHNDVTQHHQRDAALQTALTEAERANWAKSRLIAVAGHDLRQPLQTITTALELLRREGRLSDRARRVLGHAEIAATDLDEELKALAQVAGANQDLEPRLQDFRLDAVLERVANAWRARAEYKGLELRIQSTGVWVRSDPAMLLTIVRNLVGNAVKYTARGRVLVGVRRDGPAISLQVWDTGPGISPHMISKVFEAFERADAPGEGLGLGLWIVQRTAELLGHTVAVQSKPQRGSCFSLRLPRAPEG
jgi:PAS domain S-box-containing protein